MGSDGPPSVAPRFYLDDDVEEVAVLRALRARGVDVVRSHDVGMRGAADERHLERATAGGRVLISANRKDFFRIHTVWLRAGRVHAGLALALEHPETGLLVRQIVALAESRTSDEMTSAVEFLNNWA